MKAYAHKDNYELGLMANTHNPSTQRLDQEDLLKSEASLGISF